MQGGQHQSPVGRIYSDLPPYEKYPSATVEPAIAGPQVFGRGGQQRAFSQQVAQALAGWNEIEIAQVPSQKASEVTVLVLSWDKVLNALENPKWDFRTVDSIAQESRLDPSDVKALLIEHESELRRPVFPDREGRKLFTSRNRRPGWREIVHTIQRCVSKSP